MSDLANQETSMTLKHNRYRVPPYVISNANTEASKFVEDKRRVVEIEQNTPINSSQMEDAAWHRSKSARFQQN